MVDTAVAYSANSPLLMALLAFAASAAEAMLVLGALVPGTAILLALAALAGMSMDPTLLGAIVVGTALGAVAGDGLSFWLGRRFGRRLLDAWPLSRYPEWIARGQAHFDRRGRASVFWGRFVPGVKTLVPALAGIARMPTPRFLIADVSSAVVWSIATICLGVAIGRGLDQSGLADTRLLTLLGLLVGGLLVVWWALRVLVMFMMPLLRARRRRAINLFRKRQDPASAFFVQILSNEGGVVISILWVALCAAALLGFAAIVGQVIFDAGFSQADQIVSNAFQGLRFAAADAAMVAVTMAGDTAAVGPVAVAVLVWLMASGARWAAAAAALCFLLAWTFVPVVKSILGRERPNTDLYTGPEAFSFPSGHATHAMVIAGVLALLLAHRLARRRRFAIYFTALAFALLVAFSRVYLGAHWPSDVAGGLLFGCAVIAALAFVLRNRALDIDPGQMAVVLLTVFAVSYSLHLRRDFGRWMETYAFERVAVEMPAADWRADGWSRLPQTRITIDDDGPRPFLAQFAGDPAVLLETLGQWGWSAPEASAADHAISLILPRGGLAQTPPAVALHDGYLPLATRIRATETDDRRLVLRLWRSDAQVMREDGSRDPVLLVDLAAETFEPKILGFGDLDEDGPEPAETRRLRRALSASFGVAGAAEGDRPILLAGNHPPA